MVLAAAVPVAVVVLIMMASQPSSDIRVSEASTSLPTVVASSNEVVPTPVVKQPSRLASERPSQPVHRGKKPQAPTILRRRPGGPLWTPEGIANNAGSTRPPRVFPPPDPSRAIRRSYLQTRAVQFEPALIAITEPLGVGVYVAGRLVGRTPLARPLLDDARQQTVILKGPGLIEQRHEVRADQHGRFYLFARMLPVDARR